MRERLAGVINRKFGYVGVILEMISVQNKWYDAFLNHYFSISL
jgi:hypothetical protein